MRLVATLLVCTLFNAPSAFADELSPGRPPEGRREAAIPAKFTAEVGGTLIAGQDATRAALHQGGVYTDVRLRFSSDFELVGQYAWSMGHVVERLPGQRFGGVAGANDIGQEQTLHSLGLALAYLVRITEGEERFWALPYLGPRSLFLLDDVSPLWTAEVEGGLRFGVWSGEHFELSAFGGYALTVVKQDTPPAVYGTILGQVRYGAEVILQPGETFGVALGYQGDIVTLQHGSLSYQQAMAGVRCSFN